MSISFDGWQMLAMLLLIGLVLLVIRVGWLAVDSYFYSKGDAEYESTLEIARNVTDAARMAAARANTAAASLEAVVVAHPE